MKKFVGLLLGLLLVAPHILQARSQSPTNADQILAAATQQAAHEHKIVFFDFGATWCVNCRRLDAFLAQPDISQIVQKYFVFADVHYDEKAGKHPELETPGADSMMAKFGGDQGVPYFVFFSPNGEPIVTSARPVKGEKQGENIGYPDAPEEIVWFMAMLQKAVPTMTPDERKTVESSLKRLSTSHRASSH